MDVKKILLVNGATINPNKTDAIAEEIKEIFPLITLQQIHLGLLYLSPQIWIKRLDLTEPDIVILFGSEQKLTYKALEIIKDLYSSSVFIVCTEGYDHSLLTSRKILWDGYLLSNNIKTDLMAILNEIGGKKIGLSAQILQQYALLSMKQESTKIKK